VTITPVKNENLKEHLGLSSLVGATKERWREYNSRGILKVTQGGRFSVTSRHKQKKLNRGKKKDYKCWGN